MADIGRRVADGIGRETGLIAALDRQADGWLAVSLSDAGEAERFAAAVRAENVSARARGSALLLPLAAEWTAAEIDHVVLAVAKVCHYLRAPRPRIARG